MTTAESSIDIEAATEIGTTTTEAQVDVGNGEGAEGAPTAGRNVSKAMWEAAEVAADGLTMGIGSVIEGWQEVILRTSEVVFDVVSDVRDATGTAADVTANIAGAAVEVGVMVPEIAVGMTGTTKVQGAGKSMKERFMKAVDIFQIIILVCVALPLSGVGVIIGLCVSKLVRFKPVDPSTVEAMESVPSGKPDLSADRELYVLSRGIARQVYLAHDVYLAYLQSKGMQELFWRQSRSHPTFIKYSIVKASTSLGEVLVCVVRGTGDVSDWLGNIRYDLRFLMIADRRTRIILRHAEKKSHLFAVHRGAQLSKGNRHGYRQLMDYAKAGNYKAILLVGHSRGGAVAQMLGCRLGLGDYLARKSGLEETKHLQLDQPVVLHTFNAPRMASKRLANFLDTRVPPASLVHLRHVFPQDIVKAVPYECFGYQHWGRETIHDADCVEDEIDEEKEGKMWFVPQFLRNRMTGEEVLHAHDMNRFASPERGKGLIKNASMLSEPKQKTSFSFPSFNCMKSSSTKNVLSPREGSPERMTTP